jgi:Fe-S-cluster containining protein
MADIILEQSLPCDWCRQQKLTPCCKEDGFVVLSLPEDNHLIPQATLTEFTEGVYQYRINFTGGKCPFLKANGQCTIYATRPKACKEYNCIYDFLEGNSGTYFKKYLNTLSNRLRTLALQLIAQYGYEIKDDGERGF